MKIIFFALNGTFDISQIGGTDSFLRRLTYGMLESRPDLEIEYVFYGARSFKIQKPLSRLAIRRFTKLKNALKYIARETPKHVVTGYIKAKDRLIYAIFRKNKKFIIFHKLMFFYPELSLRKTLKFSEISLAPYNGKVFCVSHRIFKILNKKSQNAILLLPPIPESYFVNKSTKIKGKNIRITFLGRIDPRKGILETIKLFNQLENDSNFDCTIYGIVIPEDKKAISVHSSLISQEKIKYIEIDRQNHSVRIDKMVQEILKSTDIFVQPYRNLESTVDSPLLLLEAMASLCVILTTQVGNIKELYGSSKYILPMTDFPDNAYKILKKISVKELENERNRIMMILNSMQIEQKQVVNRFFNAIQN